jgi:FMN-dependent NADH-azoreductase
MNILRIVCSPRGRASESYRLSQAIVDQLIAAAPGSPAVVRDVDATALPHVDLAYAAALSARQDPADGSQESGALGRSFDLIQDLRDASHLVIATPMHNFTVPSSLKSWIDHVVRVRHTFQITPQGKVGSLEDRPVYVAISSGGDFGCGAYSQPDFLTPYLRYVLGTIGLLDVKFFSVQGTARGDAARQEARARAGAEIAAHSFTAGASPIFEEA